MKIAVFCSANKNIDPDFFMMTEEMGKWMAENGHDLVFGGCNSGLMDQTSPYELNALCGLHDV